MALDSENSCPHCGELINPDDAFCRNCRGTIEEEIEVQSLEGVPSKIIIPTEKLLEIEKLVKEKKIASIQFIATASCLSIEEITSACIELSFKNDGEFIFSPDIMTTGEQQAIYIPPRKTITVGELRNKLYDKKHWTNVGIVFLVIAVILYAIPMPCVSLYVGLPVGCVTIIFSFISLFTPRQRKKSIIVFVFSLLTTMVWGIQFLRLFNL